MSVSNCNLYVSTDLNKRHAQMRNWNKTGMVPKPKLQQGKLVIDDNYLFHGRLKSVWLGGLFNPLGLLTALRHEKAILGNILIDEVSITNITIIYMGLGGAMV